MNVTYEYYKDSFGGSLIPESHWKSVEVKMSARLNRYTFDRMEEGAWPAKAKTALTYTSSNKKVAAVDKNVKVTIKGAGKAVITVKAAATSEYKAATKKVTIKVSAK